MELICYSQKLNLKSVNLQELINLVEEFDLLKIVKYSTCQKCNKAELLFKIFNILIINK